MTTVYLVRHGEPDYEPVNSRGWPGAAADLSHLTPLGIRQSEAAADELAECGAGYLVSSPMTRALHTATVIGHRLALPVRVEFELREWLCDDTFRWTSFAEVLAAYDELNECGGEWPPGESRRWEPLSAVRDRTMGALRRHAVQADGPFIAVCHAVVIRSLTGEESPPLGTVRPHRLG
ncbi:MAG: histidine phosphatase family protein [Nocardioidaceae bacterium]|nr:histidine phosphatase family protein [Nocardioidaceae bacterium]